MPTATSVAITRGFLERQFGADSAGVRSLHESPDPSVRLAHYTGDGVLMFREGGIVPPLWARACGAATTLLALGGIDQFQGLIALRDSGIDAAAALRGRRIGLPRRSGQPVDFARAVHSYGISKALAAAGLAVGDVTIVDIDTTEPFISSHAGARGGSLYTAWENTRAQTAEILALVRRSVDAIYTSGGYGREVAALIDAVPVAEVPGSRATPGWAPSHLRILTASTELLVRHRDQVVRYLAALLAAARWAATHEDEAWRVVAAETGLSEEWARAGYHPDLPRQLQPETSQPLVAALAERASFLFQHGFTGQEIDVTGWLDPEPLREAQALLPVQLPD